MTDPPHVIAGRLEALLPMGAETAIEMTSIQGDWKNTAKLASGSLVITSIVKDPVMGNDLAVRARRRPHGLDLPHERQPALAD